MSLTYEERRTTILDRLEQEGKVQVVQLAEQLNVSTETVRRDLDRLEKEERLRKVYGGAVKVRSDTFEPPFQKRTEIRKHEKSAIGKLAASLVKDGETVMLDHGTTTVEVMRHLMDRSGITVITHSVSALMMAMEGFKGKFIFVGGEVDVDKQSSAGIMTESILDQFKVNKAFISVSGISMMDGLTDCDLTETYMSKKMIKQAEEVIVLTDHTKFGITTFAKVGKLDDVSMIITDQGCTKEWINYLTDKGIELLIAN